MKTKPQTVSAVTLTLCVLALSLLLVLAAPATSWAAAPDNDCVTFTSDSAFTLATKSGSATWDAGMQWSTDKLSWREWDGSAITAARCAGSTAYTLYLRGDANTRVSSDGSGRSGGWKLASSSKLAKVSCAAHQAMPLRLLPWVALAIISCSLAVICLHQRPTCLRPLWPHRATNTCSPAAPP